MNIDRPPLARYTDALMTDFILANGSMSSNQSGEASFESAFWMKTSSLSQRATT